MAFKIFSMIVSLRHFRSIFLLFNLAYISSKNPHQNFRLLTWVLFRNEHYKNFWTTLEKISKQLKNKLNSITDLFFEFPILFLMSKYAIQVMMELITILISKLCWNSLISHTSLILTWYSNTSISKHCIDLNYIISYSQNIWDNRSEATKHSPYTI